MAYTFGLSHLFAQLPQLLKQRINLQHLLDLDWGLDHSANTGYTPDHHVDNVCGKGASKREFDTFYLKGKVTPRSP